MLYALSTITIMSMFGWFGRGIGWGWLVDGLMVGQLDSGLIGPKSSPSQDHCVMSLGKTLNSPSTSPLHGVEMALTNFEGNLTKTKGNLL